MEQKSIIIIGAGIAGLAAGCYGQMNGYRTQIFELHDKPGGLCTSWQRRKSTIDGCLRWLLGSSLLEEGRITVLTVSFRVLSEQGVPGVFCLGISDNRRFEYAGICGLCHCSAPFVITSSLFVIASRRRSNPKTETRPRRAKLASA